MVKQLNEILEAKRFDDFFTSLPKIVSELTEKERQELLVDIIDLHYDHKMFSDFKKAFDLLIDSKLNLNFNIEHWAPTFLSLVVLRTPSIELFNYFVKKGANINFIGDCYAFESEAITEKETEELGEERYSTCLDFAQLKLADLLTVDYNFTVPEKRVSESDDKVAISREEYLYLHEQSEYLYDLINTDKLVDHIKSLGGKTYEELKKEKKVSNVLYKA